MQSERISKQLIIMIDYLHPVKKSKMKEQSNEMNNLWAWKDALDFELQKNVRAMGKHWAPKIATVQSIIKAHNPPKKNKNDSNILETQVCVRTERVR